MSGEMVAAAILLPSSTGVKLYFHFWPGWGVCAGFNALNLEALCSYSASLLYLASRFCGILCALAEVISVGGVAAVPRRVMVSHSSCVEALYYVPAGG